MPSHTVYIEQSPQTIHASTPFKIAVTHSKVEQHFDLDYDRNGLSAAGKLLYTSIIEALPELQQ